MELGVLYLIPTLMIIAGCVLGLVGVFFTIRTMSTTNAYARSRWAAYAVITFIMTFVLFLVGTWGFVGIKLTLPPGQ